MMPIDSHTPCSEEPPQPAGEARSKRRLPLRSLFTALGLGAAVAAFFALGGDALVSPQILANYSQELQRLAAYWGAPLLFILAYAAATGLSLPTGLVMSIGGGFMFGAWLGTLYVTIGATLGATVLFMVARSAFGQPLRARAGPWLARFQAGFDANVIGYLLFLRLVPVFPFFVVNLAPAFLGVSLRHYVLTTFFGILPGTFVFVSVGAGLESLLRQGKPLDPASALTPEVMTALIGLALLALLPGVVRWGWSRLKRRKEKDKTV